MDEATRLFHDAREERGEFLVDKEQRDHDRRERVLLAIGAWYTQLNHLVPLAMKAESKSLASTTDGNVGRYRADFLGAEFTARVESLARFDLDDDGTLRHVAVAPPGVTLPPMPAGELALHVSIHPYANLHSVGEGDAAAGSAAGAYRIDGHGTIDLTGDYVLAILKEATKRALPH